MSRGATKQASDESPLWLYSSIRWAEGGERRWRKRYWSGPAPCSKGEYTAAGYWLLQSPSIITFLLLPVIHFLSDTCPVHFHSIPLQLFSAGTEVCISSAYLLTLCVYLLYICLYWCKKHWEDSFPMYLSWFKLLQVRVYSINILDEPIPPSIILFGDILLIACFSHRVMLPELPVDKPSVVLKCRKCCSLLPRERLETRLISVDNTANQPENEIILNAISVW